MFNHTLRAAVIALGFSFACSIAQAQASGAATYTAKCQMCHGADGMGATPAGKAMKAIPFNDPQILSQSNAELMAATKNGKGKMPAYTGKLSDGEIKAVVTYIHTFQKK